MMSSRLLESLLTVKPTHVIRRTNRVVSNFWTNNDVRGGFRLRKRRKKIPIRGGGRFGGRSEEEGQNQNVDQPDDDDEEEMEENTKNEPEFMILTCKILKCLCHLNILPYVWDSNSQQMLDHQSPIYFYLWCLAVPFISWANFLFVLFRFVQCLLVNLRAVQKNELSAIIPIWSALAFRSIVAVMTYSMLKHMESIQSFTNKLIRYRKSDGRSELCRDFPASKILTIIFVLRTFQLIGTGVTKATRPQFVYSLLPVQWRNYFVYAIYVFLTVTSNMTTLILIYYAAFPLIMVDTLETILKTRFPPFTPPRRKLLMYRQIQILLCQFHSCVGSLALGYFKMYTLIISTTCAFGCIRFYDDLDFRIYVTMPISLITLTAYSYEWYGRSGQVPLLSQAAVKHMFDSRLEGSNRKIVYENRSCLCSCRKLVVTKVKRQTFPSIVKFVCLQTIRMLIVSSRGKPEMNWKLCLFLLTLALEWTTTMAFSGLFWIWGPGGGIGKGIKKEKHPALWVHPVYAGKTYPEFGGPPKSVPVYRDYIVHEVPKKPKAPPITYQKLPLPTVDAI